jgi:creatinine amidohydrolase
MISLPSLTLAQIEATDFAKAVLILPTGAIEQHGPHLPVGVDALMGQVWLQRTAPKLPKDAPVYVAPPITIGKSNEHAGYPGTLMISRTTLRRLILAVAEEAAGLGFGALAVLNTHGGNSAVLEQTLREVQDTHSLRAVQLSFRSDFAVHSEREAQYGIHAGEGETSWLLAATDLVQEDKRDCCWIGAVDAPGELRPEFAPATYSWVTADVSPTGTMGDATQATRAKGERWLDQGSTGLAEEITELLELL